MRLQSPGPSAVAVLCVLLVLASATVGGVVAAQSNASAGDADRDPSVCVGEMNRPADGDTVVSTQGIRFPGNGVDEVTKTMAYTMVVDERGRVRWVHDHSAEGRVWAYDVDPLPDGNYFITTTVPGDVVVEEYDPSTNSHVWTHTFRNAGDAHDADIVDGNVVVADKGNDRIFAYNRTRDEVVWEWRFNSSFPQSHGGPPEDWTHLNDVDRIDEHRYLVSAKHFNQVLVVNVTSGDVEETIGDPENTSILDEQHNPQYQVSEDGTPTILVADSENDRVVEFVETDEGWEERYVLRGGGLNQPRDADWLPNGNLLVSDRLGHRVLEVTPEGEVLWEVYAPWQTYDAERVRYGDEPAAPNSVDLNVSGTHTLDSDPVATEDLEACADYLEWKADQNTSGVAAVAPVDAGTVRTIDRVPFGLGGLVAGVLLGLAAVVGGAWVVVRRD